MNKLNKAFTLSEVLITLIIIGFVAALTIPPMVAKYQKTQYVTQLKKWYGETTNAIKLAAAEGDTVESIVQDKVFGEIGAAMTIEKATSANKRIAEIFGKYLKIKQVCSAENPCPLNTKLECSHSEWSAQYGFEIEDGAFVAFDQGGNNGCLKMPVDPWTQDGFSQNSWWGQSCQNVYVDINGPANPNRWGRDVFEFSLYRNGDLVPWSYNSSIESLQDNDWVYNCDVKTEWTNSQPCATVIMKENWEMNY